MLEISANLMILILASIVGILVVVLLIFLLLARPSAWCMIKSKVTKKPVLAVISPDKRMKFETVNDTKNRLYSTEDGDFILTTDSTYSLDGAVPFGVALEDMAMTIPGEHAKFTEKMVQDGVHSIDEIEGNPEVELSENPQPTIDFAKFKRFIKYNLNPATIRARIVYRVAAELEKPRLSVSAGTLMGIAVIIIAIGIALYLWQTGSIGGIGGTIPGMPQGVT